MSSSQQEKHFLESISVRAIIPHNTHIPLHDVLQVNEDGTVDPITDIKQRETLFIDERPKIYIVLQLPERSEDELKDYLSRLELNVEVWATDGANASNSGLSRDLIFAQKVKHDEDPLVLISQDEDDDDDSKLFLNLVWETTVFIQRPRIRLSDAHVVVVPKARINVKEESESGEEYLAPFEVTEPNLLQPLYGSRGFEKEAPFLPLSQLQPVAPRSSDQDSAFHVRSVATKPIRAYPVGITRLKYSRTQITSSTLSIIASLDLEIVPFVDVCGTVEEAETSLSNGKATSLMQGLMPMKCHSKDCLTFLFKLEALNTPIPMSSQPTKGSIDALSVSIKIQLVIDDKCKPNIHVQWSTNVDFSQALNQTYGPPTQTIQRPNRPTSLPLTNNRNITPLYTNVAQPLPIDESEKLTISFTAPKPPAKVGVPFTWTLLIVNKTPRVVKLAIIPLPRIQRPSTQAQHHAKRHALKSSTASSTQAQNDRSGPSEKDDLDIARAFVDENVVYAMQHAGAVPTETDLISLVPEVRVGPLGPGQCHESEIKIVAFKKGAFTMDAIRVVDLVREAEEGAGSPGVIVDVRDLPDIIVE